MRQSAKSPIGAIPRSTAARVRRGHIPSRRDGYGSSSRQSLVRALVVLAVTILVLTVSAIVLPPEAKQVRPGEGGGEAPVTAPH
jgi:hypothetical protein